MGMGKYLPKASLSAGINRKNQMPLTAIPSYTIMDRQWLPGEPMIHCFDSFFRSAWYIEELSSSPHRFQNDLS